MLQTIPSQNSLSINTENLQQYEARYPGKACKRHNRNTSFNLTAQNGDRVSKGILRSGEKDSRRPKHRRVTSFNLSNISQKNEKNVFEIIKDLQEDCHVQELATYLQRTKNEIDVTEMQNQEGYTVLTYTAFRSSYAAFECLINFVKRQEEKHNESEQIDTSYCETEVTKSQENKRYSRQLQSKRFKHTLKEWIELKDQTELRCCAIHLAAFRGYDNIIRLCVENGANIKQCTDQGVDALHMAAQGSSPNVLNLLLNEYKGEFDVNQADYSGANSLLWSAFIGSEVSLTFLLSCEGLNINAQNSKGQTALHLAVNSLNTER